MGSSWLGYLKAASVNSSVALFDCNMCDESNILGVGISSEISDCHVLGLYDQHYVFAEIRRNLKWDYINVSVFS